MFVVKRTFDYTLKDDRDSENPTIFKMKLITKLGLEELSVKLKKISKITDPKKATVENRKLFCENVISVSGIEDEGKQRQIEPGEFFDLVSFAVADDVLFSVLRRDEDEAKN